MSNTISGSTKPVIAYLTTAYPNVSHTFIRREIIGLEALGYQIFRVAIRCGDAIVDPLDKVECERTLHLLEQSKLALVLQIIQGLVRTNWRLIKALHTAWQLSRRSDRGLFRHFAYVAEALALLPWLAKRQVSHVHVHFGTNSAAVGMLVHRLGGPAFSMTIHGPDELDAPVGFSLGKKMCEAKFTVAISSFCASQLRRWVPYSEWQKIHIVHCTVDDSWFDNASPVSESSSTIVSVGRLSAQKGQLFLIDAYADAVRAGLQSRLVLIGDGEFRRSIEQRIQEYDLSDRIELAGWLDSASVQQRMRESRALVLPSFAEGLPVVLMEAMAMMRPVISTYIAGIPELVTDGKQGWLVIAGDRDALKVALLSLDGASVGQLREMGVCAQQIVCKNHELRTEVAKLDELFRFYVQDFNAADLKH